MSLSSFSKATVTEQRARIEREDEFAKQARERKKRIERESVLGVMGLGTAAPTAADPKKRRPVKRWMKRQRRRQREDQQRREQDEILAAASDHGSMLALPRFSTFKTSLASLVASRNHARLAILCPAAAVPRFVESVAAALAMHPEASARAVVLQAKWLTVVDMDDGQKEKRDQTGASLLKRLFDEAQTLDLESAKERWVLV